MKTFDQYHEVLKGLFPLIHDRAKLDKVNRHGLVFTLKGTSENLKPIMLTAHQDVVPASTSHLQTSKTTSGAPSAPQSAKSSKTRKS